MNTESRWWMTVAVLLRMEGKLSMDNTVHCNLRRVQKSQSDTGDMMWSYNLLRKTLVGKCSKRISSLR